MIQSGKLRDRIQVQQRDSGQDDSGQPATTWTTFATVWARVVSVTGSITASRSELFKAQQFNPEMTHQVTVRWIDGITPLNRIATDSGKILDILAVNYGERRIDPMLITCKERISQGGDEDVG